MSDTIHLFPVPSANNTLELNIIARNIINTAGESNSFNCTVTKRVGGLMNKPQVLWIEDGMVITKQSNSSAVLTFSKLNTSHGKVYICQGNISSPALPGPLSVMKSYSVTIKSKF